LAFVTKASARLQRSGTLPSVGGRPGTNNCLLSCLPLRCRNRSYNLGTGSHNYNVAKLRQCVSSASSKNKADTAG
jgi:hypothetical protein